MTNLYGLFLVKIWTLLGERGRAAVITPAEWLNADFGVPLKSYLLEENAFDGIVHFDHAANIFDGALTTAAITLLRRGRRPTEAVRFLHVQDQAALAAARVEAGRAFDVADLDPRAKWTPLFAAAGRDSRDEGCEKGFSHQRAGEQSRDREGAVTPRTRRPLELNGDRSLAVAALIEHDSRKQQTLADIARCKRGIATGANDFFTLCESDRRRLGIDLDDLRPCITKAQDITDDVLTQDHLRKLVDADKRVYLLHPRMPPAPAVERYLAEGIRRGIDRRYLPSHRPIWYMPEERPPAPILVSVFARERFRFVLNEAGVLNLTAYHGIYPHSPDREAIKALFAFLTGSETQAALTRHRRVYGDGLLKVEPRDVEALPIPDDLHAALDRESLFAGNLR
jgi:adenine-specific DNA-methyltransferase